MLHCTQNNYNTALYPTPLQYCTVPYTKILLHDIVHYYNAALYSTPQK